MCHQLSLAREVSYTHVKQGMPLTGGLSSGKEAARVRESNLGSFVEEVDAELNLENVSVSITEKAREVEVPGAHS